jgi:hypothetical protein
MLSFANTNNSTTFTTITNQKQYKSPSNIRSAVIIENIVLVECGAAIVGSLVEINW